MFDRIKKGNTAIFFGIIIGILSIFSFYYFGYPGGLTFTAMMVLFIICESFIHAYRMNGDFKYFKKLFMDTTENRIVQLDHLRVIAACTVILLHGIQFDLSMYHVFDERAAGIMNAVACVVAVCNPLYVMLSGSLLLKYKEEPLSDFYLKRVNRVVIPMVVYYFVYMFFSGVNMKAENIIEAFTNLYSGNTLMTPHYWFLFMLLGLYIVIPFYRYMLKDLPYEKLTAIVIISLIFMYFNTFQYSNLAFFPVFTEWTGVLFIGYWAIQKETRKYDTLLIILGTIACAIMVYLSFTTDDVVETCFNCSPIMVLWSLAVVSFVMKVPVFRKTNPVTAVISKFSFSILLMHWIMITFVQEKYNYYTPQYYYIGGTLRFLVVVLLVSMIYGFLVDNVLVIVCQQVFDIVVNLIRRPFRRDR